MPSAIRGPHVQLFLLALAASAGAYARTALGPLQESMRVSLALSDNQMALLQGPALALPLVLLSVPLGLATDRSRRVVIVAGLVLLALVASALTALAGSFALLLLARALAGMAGFGVNPVSFSLLADLYPPAQRGRATTAMTIGQFLGKSAAFAVGGALLAAAGEGADGWRWAMGWASLPLLLVVLLMLLLREPQRADGTTRPPPLSEAWPTLLAHRGVVAPLFGAVIFIEIGLGGALVWSAPMLQRSHGMSPEHVGGVLSLALLIGGIAGPVAGGFLADWCHKSGGPRRTVNLLAALILLTAPVGLYPLLGDEAAASVALILFIFLIFAAVVMAVTLFMIVIPNAIRGFCQALLAGSTVLFGTGLAPLAVSLLSGALGGPAQIGTALAWTCALTSLIGAAMLFAARLAYPAKDYVPAVAGA